MNVDTIIYEARECCVIMEPWFHINAPAANCYQGHLAPHPNIGDAEECKFMGYRGDDNFYHTPFLTFPENNSLKKLRLWTCRYEGETLPEQLTHLRLNNVEMNNLTTLPNLIYLDRRVPLPALTNYPQSLKYIEIQNYGNDSRRIPLQEGITHAKFDRMRREDEYPQISNALTHAEFNNCYAFPQELQHLPNLEYVAFTNHGMVELPPLPRSVTHYGTTLQPLSDIQVGMNVKTLSLFFDQRFPSEVVQHMTSLPRNIRTIVFKNVPDMLFSAEELKALAKRYDLRFENCPQMYQACYGEEIILHFLTSAL